MFMHNLMCFDCFYAHIVLLCAFFTLLLNALIALYSPGFYSEDNRLAKSPFSVFLFFFLFSEIVIIVTKPGIWIIFLATFKKVFFLGTFFVP